MQRLTLTAEQAGAVRRMTEEPTRAALQLSATGSGKTLVTVETALALKAETLFIVAPLGTLTKVWAKTLESQGWPHPIHLWSAKLPEAEQRALYDALKTKQPGAYLIGTQYYYLSATPSKAKKLDGVVQPPTRKAKWLWSKLPPVDLMVVDESHAATNRWGLMFSTLKTHKARYRVALSATPQGSKFDGFWSVCRWLWPDVARLWPEREDGSISQSKLLWETIWCVQEKVFIGRDANNEPKYQNKITGEKNPGEWVSSLPCVIDVKGWEKKPYHEVEVRVSLTPEQREIYDDMERVAIAWLQDNPTVAKLPVEQRLRLRQITLAVPTLNADDVVDFALDADSPKINAAQHIQSLHPNEPILFVTDSAKFARVAAHRLGAGLLAGTTQKGVDVVKDFGNGRLQYLVCTYQKAATGCFLPETEILTDKGFVRLDQVQESFHKVLCQDNTEPAEFRTFKKVEVPFTGDLVQLNLQGIYLPVTPNHRFDFYDYKRKTETIQSADWVDAHEGSIPAGLCPSKHSATLLTSYERLLIATQADGSLAGDCFYYAGFNKPRKIERFKNLLEDSGVFWKRISDGASRWRVRYDLKTSLAKELNLVFDVSKISAGKAVEIIDEMALWDGHRDPAGNIYYSSMVSANVDFFEIVAGLAGRSTKRSVIGTDGNRRNLHRLFIFKPGRRYAHRSRDRREPWGYNGLVHCVHVENRKCVFRYRGQVFVARNTDGLQNRCSIEVVFNPADSAVLNEQYAGRLNRMGQQATAITRYTIVARDTIDSEQYLRSAFNVAARRSELTLPL